MKEFTAYLAPEGFCAELRQELGRVEEEHGRLLLCSGPARDVIWAENVWHDVERLDIESIGKCAAYLRSLQRNWAPYAHAHHRRTELIQSKLPHVSAKPLDFGEALPSAPLGSWTLRATNHLWCASHCSSPVPNGALHFVENREDPPGRAYLKLWEVLTRLDHKPGSGDLCLDLGSSPGGWTWALNELGARVISVDKAPLERGLERLERVTYRAQSAFALEPDTIGKVDWLFCDVACYPQRLLSLVTRWLESGCCERFVCTIKLQGETDAEVVRQFAQIPRSTVRHLWHNKHELTWVCGDLNFR